MKHIQTIETRDLCQSSQERRLRRVPDLLQSACKTSCGIANQACEKKNND